MRPGPCRGQRNVSISLFFVTTFFTCVSIDLGFMSLGDNSSGAPSHTLWLTLAHFPAALLLPSVHIHVHPQALAPTGVAVSGGELPTASRGVMAGEIGEPRVKWGTTCAGSREGGRVGEWSLRHDTVIVLNRCSVWSHVKVV